MHCGGGSQYIMGKNKQLPPSKKINIVNVLYFLPMVSCRRSFNDFKYDIHWVFIMQVSFIKHKYLPFQTDVCKAFYLK